MAEPSVFFQFELRIFDSKSTVLNLNLRVLQEGNLRLITFVGSYPLDKAKTV